MRTIDFRKNWGELYFPPADRVVAVRVPALSYAAVDGSGNPNTSASFREALEALFGVSYTARFALKGAGVAEYRVAPLEALWWNRPKGGFDPGRKGDWRWTAMIMQPDVVTPARFRAAVAQLRERRNPRALAKLRLERFQEGLAAQTMHIGPYSAEAPTIERVRTFIAQDGGVPQGKHHEIYLGDPRRSAPARLRTVVRQPYRKGGH